MTTATRIYVVDDKHRPEELGVELVRCASPSQARNHVSKGQYDVRVATQEDLEKYISSGIKVQVANQE